MKLIIFIVSVISFLYSFTFLPTCDGSTNYVAAVYEHVTRTAFRQNVTTRFARKIMNENIDVYEKQIAIASRKGAQIIVFPEYGITGFFFSSNIEAFLEYIPNGYNKYLNPCTQSDFQNRPILRRLSCLARKYEITVVANMASKLPCKYSYLPCPSRGYFQYNTDLALAPDGQLVAKYNKENLYSGEKSIFDAPTPGDLTNYGLFDTGFGLVGMFTCFDILFGSPSVYLVGGIGVTDMAFPTAWMNELPLLSAIEFQQAWAMQFNVPLLAANQHLPLEKMTGSGIFNGRLGHVTYHYDMIRYTGQLLVGKIRRYASQSKNNLRPELVNEIASKLKQLSPEQLQDVSPHVLEILLYDTTAMKKFIPASKYIKNNPPQFPPIPAEQFGTSPRTFQALMNDDLYTFTPLPQDGVTVWVSNNNISCWLNYSRQAGGSDHYALGAFDGWHTTNGRYYIQACALVRCPFGDWSKCGQQTSYSGTVFNWFSLQISGMNPGAVFFPEILTAGVNLPDAGEWSNDCPACSWVYSNTGIQRPLLAASVFSRCWQYMCPQ